MLGQLGLNIIIPIILCGLACWFLTDKCGVGEWVFIPGNDVKLDIELILNDLAEPAYLLTVEVSCIIVNVDGDLFFGI